MTLIHILVFAPYVALYLIMAGASVVALKRGSGGMNALSASFGQTCCVMCILVVPFLLFFVMCLFGLAGSGFLGWGGAVVGLSAFLHEKKKSMILIVVTGLVGFSILMSAFLIGMPYPPIDLPPAILKVQQQPILGNWQN